MPEDSIMDWVNNEESLYTAKIRMFDRWIEQGDAWSEARAKIEAHRLAMYFARRIKEMAVIEGRYTKADIEEATQEMLGEFDEHREYAFKAAVERVQTRPASPEPEMTPGEREHAEKYERIAQEFGVEALKMLMPASSEKVRQALERGDRHLNTIQLYKWDDAARSIPGPLTLAEKVSLLKHVAVWHYA